MVFALSASAVILSHLFPVGVAPLFRRIPYQRAFARGGISYRWFSLDFWREIAFVGIKSKFG